MKAIELINEDLKSYPLAKEVEEIMIKFATYHVVKALAIASTVIPEERLQHIDFHDFSKGVEWVSTNDESSEIMNCYPLDEII